MDERYEENEHPGKDYEAQIVSNLKGSNGTDGPWDYDLRNLLFAQPRVPEISRCSDPELQLVANNGWGALTPMEAHRLVLRNEAALDGIRTEQRRLEAMRWKGTLMILAVLVGGMFVIYIQALLMGPKGMVP